MENKSIRSGPAPLEGICKEEKVHTGAHLPWRVSKSSHNWGIPSWVPMWGRQVPLPARKSTETDGRAGEASTVLPRGVYTLAC